MFVLFAVVADRVIKINQRVRDQENSACLDHLELFLKHKDVRGWTQTDNENRTVWQTQTCLLMKIAPQAAPHSQTRRRFSVEHWMHDNAKFLTLSSVLTANHVFIYCGKSIQLDYSYYNGDKSRMMTMVRTPKDGCSPSLGSSNSAASSSRLWNWNILRTRAK